MTDGVSGRFVSTRLAAWMQPFQSGFTAPTWQHVLVLIVGAILAPGRRTVAAALRVIGLDQDPHFTNYHRVLNRNQWSSRWLARCLLRLLIATFVPTGPVIVGLDDTIERRWGAKINARGIYRDPVRSSRSHVVKASGLRWLSLMLLPQIPWAGRVWALPFLTVLAPSERYARERQQQYKKLTDWGRQMLLQLVRWLPERRIIAVTDASFAACWQSSPGARVTPLPVSKSARSRRRARGHALPTTSRSNRDRLGGSVYLETQRSVAFRCQKRHQTALTRCIRLAPAHPSNKRRHLWSLPSRPIRVNPPMTR